MSVPLSHIDHRERLGERLHGTAFAAGIVLAVCLAPILLTQGLFLTDVPGHLYRVSLLDDILHHGAPSRHFYVAPGLFPNMALDAAASILTRIMSPKAAIVLFLCGTAVAYIASLLYWRACLGEKTDAPLLLLMALVFYSEPLHWGLVNYVFALSVLHLALALLTKQALKPSPAFPVTQAVLLAVLCLSSIFPVMLYIAFCAGMALESLRRAPRAERPRVLGRLVRLHGLSALTVLALVSVMEPGQNGETLWDFWTKFLGVFSVAKTTNVVPEYALSALVLVCLALLSWRRGWAVGGPARAGLIACCVLYLVLPRELMSVGQADRRLAPAIAGFVIAFIRGPQASSARLSAAMTAGLFLLLALKAALLIHVWSPLADLRASYRAIAAAIPVGASVMSVPALKDERPPGAARAFAYLKRAARLEAIPPEEAHDYVYYTHLHLAEMAGKDIASPNIFTNFALKPKPGVNLPPFLGTASDLPDLREKLRHMVPAPGLYVIAHRDLDAQRAFPPGWTLRLVTASGPVRLYRTEAVAEGRKG